MSVLRTHNHGLWALCTAGAGLLLAALAAAAADDPQALERDVREWLALRREAVRSRSEWQEQKTLLEEEARLLERERDDLAQARQAREQEGRDLATRLAGLEREHAKAAATLTDLAPAVRAAEAALRTLQPAIPPPLAAGLLAAFAQLPAADATPAVTPDSIAGRLQAVLSVTAQIGQTGRSLNTGRLCLQAPDGREREMDVLFLGLAVGFAVAPDGTAATAVFADGAWTWTWDSTLAPAVRRALAAYRKETVAGFVDLPVRVKGDAP